MQASLRAVVDQVGNTSGLRQALARIAVLEEAVAALQAAGGGAPGGGGSVTIVPIEGVTAWRTVETTSWYVDRDCGDGSGCGSWYHKHEATVWVKTSAQISPTAECTISCYVDGVLKTYFLSGSDLMAGKAVGTYLLNDASAGTQPTVYQAQLTRVN